jgi:hypothetical protein
MPVFQESTWTGSLFQLAMASRVIGEAIRLERGLYAEAV